MIMLEDQLIEKSLQYILIIYINRYFIWEINVGKLKLFLLKVHLFKI